jgi:hypothetical protein
MKQEKFLDLFFNGRENIIVGKQDGYSDVTDIKNLKLLTSLMDYDCRFTKKGVCKHHKGSNYAMCCCGGCKGALGYLKTISYKDVNTYAEKFDEKTGFWRTDGCSLPRELRSGICLRHNCKSKLTDVELDLMSLLTDYTPNSRKKAIEEYKKKYDLPYYDSLADINDHLKARLEAK